MRDAVVRRPLGLWIRQVLERLLELGILRLLDLLQTQVIFLSGEWLDGVGTGRQGYYLIGRTANVVDALAVRQQELLRPQH